MAVSDLIALSGLLGSVLECDAERPDEDGRGETSAAALLRERDLALACQLQAGRERAAPR